MSDGREEYPKPYENEFQKWVAESDLAGYCIGLWEIGAASTVFAGILYKDYLFIAGGSIWLFVTLLIHFWRDELAPEMRTSEGESDE